MTAAKSKGKKAGQGSRWGLLVVAVLVVGALAAAGYHRLKTQPPPQVPPEDWIVPDATELAAPVERMLREAQARVAREPTSAVAWGQLGSVFKAHFLHPQAIECFERAETLDPSDYRWPYLRSTSISTEGGSSEASVAAGRRAAALAPDVPAIGFFLAVDYLQLNRFEESVAELRRILELDPKMAVAHRVLGQAYLGLEEYDKALASLERAVQLVPNDKRSLGFLAQAYRASGMLAEATEAEQRAAVAEGDSRVTDPVGFAVNALRRDPAGTSKRAKALMDAGRVRDAMEQWEYFLETNPDSAGGWRGLADCHLRAGELEMAQALLLHASRVDPSLPITHLELAYLARQQGDLEAVWQHATDLLELQPQDVEARCLRAHALSVGGRLLEGIAEFEIAAALAKTGGGQLPPAAEHDWAVALLRAGRPAQALPHVEAALAATNPQAASYVTLGDVHVALGNLVPARGAYQQALQIDPDLEEARERLAQLGPLGP